jgi:carbamoyl-phosphate synthase small subunit
MVQLLLQDGTTVEGKSFGAEIDTDGEVVFNTGMVGYPESLTDPSYRGQILVFTYPLIGNYGVPSEDLNEYGFSKNFESEDIHVRGVICSQVSHHYSHSDAVMSLPDWLKKHNIPGITEVDTRALTKKLREKGVMLGRIVHGSGSESGSDSIEDPNTRNLVAEVSCLEVHTYDPIPNPNPDPKTVVAFDCGMKRNILRAFLKRGVCVHRVPWDFNLSHFDQPYDGVFISNGPGDPKMCRETIKQAQWALEHGKPTFGICLGIQLMALAVGGDTYKLKYGHRGVNQPCVERGNAKMRKCENVKCIITSQNHGFAVDEKSLPKGWRVWFTNANDGTVEGIRHEKAPFLAVQFHPEATPGPEDANYLFDEFLAMLRS